jgi:predicted dehydrogenase
VETFTADRVGDVPREEVAVTSEDAAAILLRFDDGARGVLTVSQVSAGRKNALSLEVSGSTAGLAWNSEDPERLWIGHRGAPNELLLRDPSLMSPEARRITHYPGGHAEGFAESFLGLVETVYAAVAERRRPETPAFPTFADGLEGLYLEDAVLASHESGRWAPVRRNA